MGCSVFYNSRRISTTNDIEILCSHGPFAFLGARDALMSGPRGFSSARQCCVAALLQLLLLFVALRLALRVRVGAWA